MSRDFCHLTPVIWTHSLEFPNRLQGFCRVFFWNHFKEHVWKSKKSWMDGQQKNTDWKLHPAAHLSIPGPSLCLLKKSIKPQGAVSTVDCINSVLGGSCACFLWSWLEWRPVDTRWVKPATATYERNSHKGPTSMARKLGPEGTVVARVKCSWATKCAFWRKMPKLFRRVGSNVCLTTKTPRATKNRKGERRANILSRMYKYIYVCV